MAQFYSPNRRVTTKQTLTVTVNSLDPFGHVELVLAANGPLMVLRHLDTLKEVDRAALIDFAKRVQVAVYLAGDSDNVEKLIGEEPYYQIEGLRLAFHPRDFIQVNDTVNQQMVA